MLLYEREKLASILNTTAETLDIPDYVYEDATIKYENVGDHLDAHDSALRQYEPKIYVQGSFLLGTVVQPLSPTQGYDIDLVCRLSIDKESITQDSLKRLVGDRLKCRVDLKQMLSESRRVWILEYPASAGMPKFHMDVLPCLPNADKRPDGILLTDRELSRWQLSNPLKYAAWFETQMKIVFEKRRMAIAEAIQASVEEVPVWQVKAPLQRVVQILKRHRDTHFINNPDNRPISIIITTLAARAYKNEEDIFEALTGVVDRMPNWIEYINGKWWVKNPVEEENFADKWNYAPDGERRRLAFLSWLKKVRADVQRVAETGDVRSGVMLLQESMGSSTMADVAGRLGFSVPSSLPAPVRQQPFVPALGTTAHARPPQWPVVETNTAKVSGAVYFKKGLKKGRLLWPLTDKPVPKNVWVRFKLRTDALKPYHVRWQVVNTGQAAAEAGELRGDFYDTAEPDKDIHWEPTMYSGTHYVEAFVLKGGLCVARSGRILVKVR